MPPSPVCGRSFAAMSAWALSMVCCWTSASPRPSWTRPDAVSVSPRMAPWTCGWTTVPVRRPRPGWRRLRRRTSPGSCTNTARSASADVSPAPLSPRADRRPSSLPGGWRRSWRRLAQHGSRASTRRPAPSRRCASRSTANSTNWAPPWWRCATFSPWGGDWW